MRPRTLSDPARLQVVVETDLIRHLDSHRRANPVERRGGGTMPASRGTVVSAALREYLGHHRPDEPTPPGGHLLDVEDERRQGGELIAEVLRSAAGIPEPTGPGQAAAWDLERRIQERRPGRPLIIGEAPGRGDWPAFHGGQSGRRLASLLGWSWEELVRRTERLNLVQIPPGGDRPDPGAMRAAARRIAPLLRGRRALLAGRAVSSAFGLRLRWFSVAEVEFPDDPETWPSLRGTIGEPHAAFRDWNQLLAQRGTAFRDWRPTDDLLVAVVPHPSGRSRYWNEPENTVRARDFLRAALKKD